MKKGLYVLCVLSVLAASCSPIAQASSPTIIIPTFTSTEIPTATVVPSTATPTEAPTSTEVPATPTETEIPPTATPEVTTTPNYYDFENFVTP
jgi:hypothetical protein